MSISSSRMRKLILLSSVASGTLAAACMITAHPVSAWQSPTKHKYLTKPLQICDQGTFYVGGAPKVTPFGGGPHAGQPYTDN